MRPRWDNPYILYEEAEVWGIGKVAVPMNAKGRVIGITESGEEVMILAVPIPDSKPEEKT